MVKNDGITADTSLIIDGTLRKNIEKQEIVCSTLFLHESIIDLFEELASQNQSLGHVGIKELTKLRELSKKSDFNIKYSGKSFYKDTLSVSHVDKLTREIAYDENLLLLTANPVTKDLATAKGITCLLLETTEDNLMIETFFDKNTMSVHLKEGTCPYAKKGVPGNWNFVEVDKAVLTRQDLQTYASDIIEKSRSKGFIEIERPGSTIVQIGMYRIVMTRPPLSDNWEITAVRPVKQLNLADYNLSEKLMERMRDHAEGILIAGSPGMGKSTFAKALAEMYSGMGKIVKTIEAPRDMLLHDAITQYAISHCDSEEIHDILLLSRPDNTIFDEMRNTQDFKLFADLRLSGIGLAGVIHASRPVDAIQRFVGRIELGVIPQVIDTVVFIKDGKVENVLSLHMVVKVPSGMTEADLARPVVVVADFEDMRPLYELYSYGEETVVVPVDEKRESVPTHNLASQALKDILSKYTADPLIEFTSDRSCIIYVPKQDRPRIIGKNGTTIENIEKELKLKIDIREKSKKGIITKGEQVSFETKLTNKALHFILPEKYKDMLINIFLDEDFLLQAKAGKNGVLKITRKNKIGKLLSESISQDNSVTLFTE